MKKNYILSLGMMFAGTFCMTANTDFSKAPFIMPNTPAAAEVTAQIPFDVVFSEDFSKFTAGTEAAPDATDIGGDDNNGYVIDSKYVSVPGTYGKGVHQAGGVCALKIYEYTYPGYPDVYKSGGYISTPEAPLFGEVEISFRAKKTTANGNLWVGLCDNVNGPVDTKDYVLTDEWKAYTFKSDKGTFTDNNVVQFSAQNESEILIDDIVIKRAVTKTEPPMADYPINKSFTEFVARWTKTKTAEKYRLNVYKKVESADYVKGTLKEGFDNIKVKEDGVSIDTANPNYPEGWTVNVSKAGKQDMNNAEGFYGSAPQSIILDEVGDTVITPETPAFINEIRFWVRPSSMSYEDSPSMIGICVWDSKIKKWIAIANLPNYYFQDGGMVYTFNSDQIGLNVNKVKFDYIQKGSGAIAFSIDDIELDYETQLVDEPVLVNYETTDTFCVVNNVDPTHEHYYYVQAIQGSLVSEKTSDMWVNAITGLKPVIDAPKNVTGTGFDITWTKFWNAREYAVELSKIVKAADDMKGVVVLEENFDKIKDGTVDNPGMDWGASYDFADNGMCDTLPDDFLWCEAGVHNGAAGKMELHMNAVDQSGHQNCRRCPDDKLLFHKRGTSCQHPGEPGRKSGPFKDFPDGLLISQYDHNIVRHQNRVGGSLPGVTSVIFYHHHHDIVCGHDGGFREGRVPEHGGNLMQIHMSYHHIAVVLHKNHPVPSFSEHDPVAEGLNGGVKPAPEKAGPAQQMEGDQQGQSDGNDDDQRFHLVFAEGHEKIDGGGDNGHSEGVAEEHGGLSQLPADPGGDNGFSLPGGIAGIGQQGNDLEPGLFRSQPRETEKNGDNIGDYDVNDDKQSKQNERCTHSQPPFCGITAIIS